MNLGNQVFIVHAEKSKVGGCRGLFRGLNHDSETGLGCCTRGQETARNCTFVPLGRWLLSLMLNHLKVNATVRLCNYGPVDLSSSADGPKPKSPAEETEAGAEIIKKGPPIVFKKIF